MAAAVKQTCSGTETPGSGGRGRHAVRQRGSQRGSRTLPSVRFGISSIKLLEERYAHQSSERYRNRIIGETTFFVTNGSDTYIIRRVAQEAGEGEGVGRRINRRPVGLGGFLVLDFPSLFAVILGPSEFRLAYSDRSFC